MKKYKCFFQILLVPVLLALLALGCDDKSGSLALSPQDQGSDIFGEIETGQTSGVTNEDDYPALPPLPDPDKMGPLPEGFVYGGDIIYARDYQVGTVTDEMRKEGLLVTVDGTQYYYPRKELCGRYLTVLFDDGHVGFMRMSCY
ncbi:MAG: hypothetical protein A3F83_00465 [Candidatus Glassbacteria bacterium RIFCSPLOWO2_12_FULL_58_11]|uniref:Uncharacterized protein n=1 Tax=Candidatus Glassbacteria bacterium RIFCSPLOWO2_12_FULL_58_11 TaxID=1817867 RepID=A0A1F5YNF9_9BACT|nr:MAG: hypothetical protein A3F83_00465 [Candidatus Glassbacteria bacterium RIFCSPLOWO2_12_FULL_58_11]